MAICKTTKPSAVIGYLSGQDGARSGLPAVSRKGKLKRNRKPYNKYPLLTNDIGLFLFLQVSVDLDSVSAHNLAKKEHGQYPAVLNSRFVKNPYVI